MRFWRKKQGWLIKWALGALMEVSALLPLPILVLALSEDPAVKAAVPGYGPFLAVYLAASLTESAFAQRSDRMVAAFRVGGAVFATILAYIWSYAALPSGLAPGGLLSVNPATAVIPFAWIAWGWASEAVASGLTYYDAFDRFRKRAPLLAIAVPLALLAQGAGASAVNLLLYWNVLLFFIAGLTLLFLTRQQHVRAEQYRIGDTAATGTGRPATLWLVVALLVLSVGAAHLLSVEALAASGRRILTALQPLLEWFWDVALLLLFPYVYLFFRLVESIMSGLQMPKQEEDERNFQPGEPVDQLNPDELQGALAQTDWLRWVLIALVALFLIRWLLTIKRSRSQEAEGEGDEVRESLGFWQQLWLDLRSLWLSVRGRVQIERARTRAGHRQAEEAGTDPRALFRRLQRWGARQGRPRRLSETPAQYRDGLAQLAPEGDEALGHLTSLYQQARYGATEPTAAAVEAGADAMAALQRVEGAQKQ